MGLLDGLLGGVVGAEMVTVVNGLIEKHGGVQGIVAQLEQQGLGNTVRSWVGTGANQPITADQIHQVGLSEIDRIQSEMLAIAKKEGFADLASFRESLKKNPKYIPTSADQILDDLEHDVWREIEAVERQR